MSAGTAGRLEPLFLDGAAGRLFAVHYPPQGDAPIRRAVVYLPPFAEEMNRARRVAALLARRLAESGWGALLLDPYGSGDSEGDFAAARWEIWREDAASAVRFLTQRGYGEVVLVGLRLGALLALDAQTATTGTVRRVILWQPVLRGDQMLTQFLRLRLAAGLAGGKSGTETTQSLRARLKAGETLEIAGYELAPELAFAIEALRLETLVSETDATIDWVAVQAADAPAPPGQEETVDAWRRQGRDVRLHRVAAEPFWSLQETTLAPALVELTAAMLEGAAP